MRADYLREIEFAILSKMEKSPTDCAKALTLVSRDDFSSEMGNIFAAMHKLQMEGKSIDGLIMTSMLGDAYKDFIELLKTKSFAGTLEEYCTILRNASRLEDAQLYGTELACSQSIEDAEKKIEKLTLLLCTRNDVRHMETFDAINRFVDRMADETEKRYIPWGIKALDKALYVEPGDFVVLGGYPSAGKTALSCQMALLQAQSYRVGYFSLETSIDKLTDRIMAYSTGVSLKKIKNRSLEENDWRIISEMANSSTKLNLELFEASGMSAQDIFAEAISHRLDIIYVDYLQLLKSRSRGGNRYEEVTRISADLHTLAQRHKICVVALAQLSRPEQHEGRSRAPTMQSFKESGQIEQDADVGLLLYLEDDRDYNSQRVLKIAKNKEGERGSLKLMFDGEKQRFCA